ncbi:MAG: pyruvate dehydrogenase (acetyl-transferring) E1 component subunit alpha [Acidobacteria bacterium]|nr:pyruvate dehydrogenase (acetyl-transferring) E1 component subunit alpha [Acidobacteriota bacterium]
MPRTIIHECAVERLEILGPEGQLDTELMPELDDETVRALYRDMVRMRTFDDKAVKLQRQGRMGTWAQLKGQEAIQAGVALAMIESDWLIPAFREHGLMLLRGVPGHLIYAYWAGDERGASFPEGVRCLPIAVPVGSQLTHGAGIGLSLKLRGEHAAAVTFGGDGATSEGDFHEALNFAGVFGTKTVFVIQNNQWAISMPRKRQTSSPTLAQKADAYGIPGLQVDGNDVFAVYTAAVEAFERARSGGGPSLIEAVTYRLGDHTTADDATRYRTGEELEYWQRRDPIPRLRRHLEGRGLWDAEQDQALKEEAVRWVASQVDAFNAMPMADPGDIFRFMYHEVPPALAEQLEWLEREVRA